MKKLKFALTAAVVFAVVGGALAFKAQKITLTPIYGESPLIPNFCDQPASITTTDDVNGILTKYRLQSEGTGTCFNRNHSVLDMANPITKTLTFASVL